jgi:hypothetical protein
MLRQAVGFEECVRRLFLSLLPSAFGRASLSVGLPLHRSRFAKTQKRFLSKVQPFAPPVQHPPPPLQLASAQRERHQRALLEHMLEKMSLDEYLVQVEKKLGTRLRRSPFDPAHLRWTSQELPHSHVGEFPQKQAGLPTD